MTKLEIINDNFQNYKRYNIPKAQLVIADIPYNLGANAYGSSLEWWQGGNKENGATAKAGKAFFPSDYSFNLAEYMHFCSKLLKKEPKEKGKAPAMIVFCSFQQMPIVIKYGEKHGFKNHYPLIFIKNTSGQVLKANMKIVGATEYAVVLYRDKLPKFNNSHRDKKMVLNWFNFPRDDRKIYPKCHPTQKPVALLKELIEVFTDEGDIVIDPCCGSGTTLRASYELGRHSYGFEIYKPFFKEAKEKMCDISKIQIEDKLF